MSTTRTARSAGRRVAWWRPSVALVVAGLALVGPEGVRAAERLALTLDDAIAMALRESKGLSLATMREEAASARVGQARSAFFPQISGTGAFTRLDEAPYMDASGFGDIFSPLMVPFQYLVEHDYLDPGTLVGLTGGGAERITLGDDEMYSLGLSVRQPLFTGGAILGSYGAAKHGALAERWNRERAEHELRYHVAEAYLNLVRAQRALDVMEKSVRQVRSHLADVEGLFEAGMILEKDVMAGRVRAAEVELGRNSAEHGVELAMAGLCFAMGIDVETEIEPLDGLDAEDLPARDLSQWVTSAVAERPDLRAAEEGALAAEKSVAIARSSYFPQVVVAGAYAWDRPNRAYEPEFYGHWSVTLAVEMSVFDWGRTASAVRESKLGYLQAAKAVELMEDAVRLEVRQAYLICDEARQAVGIAADGLALALEAVRITRESFANGMATNSDVLDAESALTAAELESVASAADLRLAKARLELATGVNDR